MSIPGSEDTYRTTSHAAENRADASKKPRVLLLVPRLHIGGAERYVASLAESLHGRGYEIVLASQNGRFAQMLRRDYGIRRYPVYLRFNTSLAAHMVERIVRSQKIDLIHANLADAGEVAAIVGAKLGVPWVLTAHTPIGKGPQCQKLLLTDKVVSVSEFLTSQLLAESDFGPEQIVTISNGVDTSVFRLRGAGLEVRRRWGVGENDFLVGISARVRTPNGKGHSDLIRMLASCPEAADWRLAIIGCGRATRPLKKLARELGVSARVHFVGHISDVPSAIEALDAAVLPSYAETFGLAIAEAMAMCRPIAAYAVGGIPELIEDGETGFLSPVGDFESLARNLHAIRTNADMTERMCRKARERVERLFSLEKMVDQVEQIYEDAMCRRRGDGVK